MAVTTACMQVHWGGYATLKPRNKPAIYPPFYLWPSGHGQDEDSVQDHRGSCFVKQNKIQQSESRGEKSLVYSLPPRDAAADDRHASSH